MLEEVLVIDLDNKLFEEVMNLENISKNEILYKFYFTKHIFKKHAGSLNNGGRFLKK